MAVRFDQKLFLLVLSTHNTSCSASYFSSWALLHVLSIAENKQNVTQKTMHHPMNVNSISINQQNSSFLLTLF